MTSDTGESPSARGWSLAWGEPLTDIEGRNRGRTLAVVVLAVAGLFVWPWTPLDGVVLCPFRATTGLACPGCGMMRACRALLAGRLAGSLTLHPFALPLVVVATLAAGVRSIELLVGRRVAVVPRRRWRRVLRTTVWFALVGLLCLWLARLYFGTAPV